MTAGYDSGVTARKAPTTASDPALTETTYWPAGFNAGERAVRDPAGVVVVTDGDVLQGGQQLHGFDVCLAPTKLYVMLARTGG